MHIIANQIRPAADDATALLKALASPHRLMIVCALIGCEQSVGALAEALGVRETVISQHLAVLRRERIVSPRRDGQSIYYSITQPAARAVVDVLAGHFCTATGVRIDHPQTTCAAPGG